MNHAILVKAATPIIATLPEPERLYILKALLDLPENRLDSLSSEESLKQFIRELLLRYRSGESAEWISKGSSGSGVLESHGGERNYNHEMGIDLGGEVHQYGNEVDLPDRDERDRDRDRR